MTIPDFKPEDFSQDLARQAQQLVPSDLTEYQKKYVVNKLYQFCILAGNALNQDTNLVFTNNEAQAIVQLIGEWTFHKNVDLIRAKIAEDCWDPVLQQVAFAVFETAKQVESKKVETNQAIKMIEDVVKESYNKSLMELARNGKINENEIPEILSYSNIDSMATESQQEITPDIENKLLKCASLALVLKSMPQNKVNRILAGFDKQTALQISHLIQTPDLENQIDLNSANNILFGFKQTFSAQDISQQSSSVDKISTLRDLYDEHSIIKHVQYERPLIQQYVQNNITQKTAKIEINMSSYIENIVYNYLVSKLTA
ncbi:MAG: hypothetical protein PHC34_05235 [Candidatus Gastranaerophilales bacterium]|nr:hypothetical protein [Candidatus Gastranaerophilales bacterium]